MGRAADLRARLAAQQRRRSRGDEPRPGDVEDRATPPEDYARYHTVRDPDKKGTAATSKKKESGSYTSWQSLTAPRRSRSALKREARTIFALSIKECPSHIGLGRVLTRAAAAGFNQEGSEHYAHCALCSSTLSTPVVHQPTRTTANNRESTYRRIGCFAGVSEQGRTSTTIGF